eukprot:scaffold8259_cov143-Cylindrotheca_fusiformis.AAC.25
MVFLIVSNRALPFTLVFFCYVTVRSFTLHVTCSPFKGASPPNSLLFSRQDISEFAKSDSELIHRLIRAKTTIEIKQTLRDARQNTNVTNGQKCDLYDHFSLDVSATSLRRIAHVEVMESRQKSADISTQHVRTQLITSLMVAIRGQLELARDSPGSLINIYVLADLLSALAVLQSNRSKDCLEPVAKLVLEMLKRHDPTELSKLGPIRLVQCLQALTRLQLDEPQLQNPIYKRLLKPDAVSKIPARSLSHGLAALAKTDMSRRDSKILSRAFMRRLRKQKVREDASLHDLCRALVAVDEIFKKKGMEEFKDEAAVFGFTSLRVVMDKRQREHVKLTPRQISDLVYAWSRLSNNEREDNVIEELLEICKMEAILDKCNLDELARIIGSVERLRISNHSEIMQMGGERLLDIVMEANELSAIYTLSPNNVNCIIRCPVLLHRKNKAVMAPYIEAASHLFHDEKFIEACSLSEIANFLWFKSIANWRDDDILDLFCRRLLDPDTAEFCSPKLASRILGAFTLILSFKKADKFPKDVLLDNTWKLFHSYGAHLLTSKLQPAEASSALYAYASASYIQDMGIFDHLVLLTASMADQCTARQLSQSLWSCGRMVEFEQCHFDEDKQLQGPPYLEHAIGIAKKLCSRSNELTPADVAQCIWALAKLGVENDAVVSPFTTRATSLVPNMNVIEATNILWALGKMRYSNFELTSTLAEKLTRNPLQPSPKQAASALYALGRLRVKDKELYDTLSLSITSQIEDTSAHAIANVLWAYKTVSLKPPVELLDLWASEKLGLRVDVQFPRREEEGSGSFDRVY